MRGTNGKGTEDEGNLWSKGMNGEGTWSKRDGNDIEVDLNKRKPEGLIKYRRWCSPRGFVGIK